MRYGVDKGIKRRGYFGPKTPNPEKRVGHPIDIVPWKTWLERGGPICALNELGQHPVCIENVSGMLPEYFGNVSGVFQVCSRDASGSFREWSVQECYQNATDLLWRFVFLVLTLGVSTLITKKNKTLLKSVRNIHRGSSKTPPPQRYALKIPTRVSILQITFLLCAIMVPKLLRGGSRVIWAGFRNVQGCYLNVSGIYQEKKFLRNVRAGFWNALGVFQKCFRIVSRMFQKCFSKRLGLASGLFPKCFTKDSGWFQECFRKVSGIRIASGVFLECFSDEMEFIFKPVYFQAGHFYGVLPRRTSFFVQNADICW